MFIQLFIQWQRSDPSVDALLALRTFEYQSPRTASPEPPSQGTAIERIQLPPLPESILLGVVQRIIHHLTADDEVEEEEDSKAYNQGSAPIFKYICNLLGIDIGAFGPKPTKRKLFEAIQLLVSPAG